MLNFRRSFGRLRVSFLGGRGSGSGFDFVRARFVVIVEGSFLLRGAAVLFFSLPLRLWRRVIDVDRCILSIESGQYFASLLASVRSVEVQRILQHQLTSSTSRYL